MSNHKLFDIYIPSKGRYKSLITSRYLSLMKTCHYIIVEEQEYELYKEAVEARSPYAELIVLDEKFRSEYDALGDYGNSKGSGPARNFAWGHSIAKGMKWHWVMDDNIYSFKIFNNNKKYDILTDAFFRSMEEFCLRYSNLAMAGPAYVFNVPRNEKRQPYITNTRIYSCNLIRNDVPFRWRGRYNEDTILSLDMLKAGWCTVQFNMFLQNKAATQTVKGGNTSEIYGNGTKEKSDMLVRTHPDVAFRKFLYGRHHHYVYYDRFKLLRLKKAHDYLDHVCNFNLILKEKNG